jgi:hypothetical protein
MVPESRIFPAVHYLFIICAVLFCVTGMTVMYVSGNNAPVCPGQTDHGAHRGMVHTPRLHLRGSERGRRRYVGTYVPLG